MIRMSQHSLTRVIFNQCTRGLRTTPQFKFKLTGGVLKEQEQERKEKISTRNVPPSDGGPITWRSLLIGGSTLAGITGYFLYLKRLKQEKIEREKTRTYGKAAIGGSFELVDTTGKLRKSDEFLGNWLLIYFGFTHCPDVCPEELDKLATVVERLSKRNYKVLPLFISVDPERDTPELVGKYLSEFSDKFIGLTGTKEQVEKATRAHRVYYSVGPKDEENDYIVDHTIISYLINPNGELVDYFGQTKQAEEMEATIMFHMSKLSGNRASTQNS
jgi:protein SCO1/2